MRIGRTPSWAAIFVTAVVCIATGEDMPLPKGFPDPLGSDERNGPYAFLTTAAYEKEARRLLLQEATQVAAELGLQEELPLTESNIVQSFIAPFGFAYIKKGIGNLTSRRYWYASRVGWRLNMAESREA